jgi:hypothetical protein
MSGPVVLNIKDATVQFALTETAVTTAPDFTCQVTSAAIKANPKLQTVPATFCAAESQSPSASGWQLDLTWLQDWGATDSMSQFMFDNDTALMFFSIVPVDPAAPAATGQCYVVAGDYLGAAGTVLTATATCPLPVKPTITGAGTLVAEAEASGSGGGGSGSQAAYEPAGV